MGVIAGSPPLLCKSDTFSSEPNVSKGENMNIPKDPVMLMSYINTQLRDNYPSLSELAKSLGLDENEIMDKLNGIGMKYDPDLNKFVSR